ncbi:MAG: sodium/proline symporter [Simkaniaceae bacterium]|nr:sodium/proline symporter [Simkaniaceae bacterium]MCF7852505.1 sodium/proline symporter [Simkaniaceae bacterium]
MLLSELSAIAIYISILIGIAIASYKRNQTSADFIIGGRGLNFWLTALAAHASDMSSWIFMGYPVILFSVGISNVWLALGLIIFMFINWHLIAPKIRVATEKFDAMTFSTFFESRFHDTSGTLRIITALMNLLFFTIYISASFNGLGLLLETLFNLPYWVGLTIGVLIVTPYLFVGGYITLAWTDFFQGIFLLLVILSVPIIATFGLGGMDDVIQQLNTRHFFDGLIPSHSIIGYLSVLFLMMSWGLGYFGQPHIITKFMGIKDVKKIRYSKYVGMTWQVLIMTSATLIGMVAIVFFKDGIANKQLIFVEMTRSIFTPFAATFILCAIIGATLTHADSQILVLASSLTEDLYKRILRKTASSKEILLVSRLSILFVSLLAYCIAYNKISSIFALVEYAWFGLGSSFGPLLIFSLYSKKANKYGACSGVLTGGIVAALWPLVNRALDISIPTLIPSFALSALMIWGISLATQHKVEEIRHE